ncbi:neutral/alkaline non-lysosomal ceramidase N-terminal domain-containing protein [Streptomyces iconiensis]|uniref:Neutral/alkaline non-lysosomal ceramidase N-terminal domain-containing protein n=1 Tax=Streptomyces iconiensis TaxID=1384038 RepID=A0ABT7A3D1_9ACTN|nr:neutral/alkaline non-lysosomal ceramidase N-terminal domain-containing protein [Streptomyces iconiensis]MDJ1135579.1 neutral/alkaline non-lysosomal ceramidase N-terminal domain-containing protein [Streptomyces iconiensis]
MLNPLRHLPGAQPLARRSLLGTAVFGAAACRTRAPAPAGGAGGDLPAFSVATGRADITPRLGKDTWLAGYATTSGPRVATGVRRRLYARCTVLRHSGVPHLIVTADVLGIPPSVHQAVRTAVRRRYRVSDARLILTATHTHGGPVLPEHLDPYISYGIPYESAGALRSYTRRLVRDLTDLVGRTLSSRATPCSLEFHMGHEDFAVNRAGLPHAEVAVPVLVARNTHGGVRAVLFGYGCHPVAAGGVEALVDSDYPGVAVARVEEALPGAFAHFLLGAAGDQNPGTRDQFGPDHCERVGARLAGAVTRALAGPGRTLHGPLAAESRRVALPLDVPRTPREHSVFAAAFASRLRGTATAPVRRRHAHVMLRQLATRSYAGTVHLPVHVWKLGGTPGLALALTGGELVSGYAGILRSRHGGPESLWIGGYANETCAYIPTDELLLRTSGGSYEGGWDRDHPRVAGGSMAPYGWLSHFRGKADADAADGVEQILVHALDEMLTTTPRTAGEPGTMARLSPL